MNQISLPNNVSVQHKEKKIKFFSIPEIKSKYIYAFIIHILYIYTSSLRKEKGKVVFQD